MPSRTVFQTLIRTTIWEGKHHSQVFDLVWRILCSYCPNTWDGRLAQVAGIEYSVNCNAAVGSRVTISQVQKNGVMQAFGNSTTYLLAANDFMVRSATSQFLSEPYRVDNSHLGFDGG